SSTTHCMSVRVMRPATSTLFPYTTLFRSVCRLVEQQQVRWRDPEKRELESRTLAAGQQPDLPEGVVPAEEEPGEIAALLGVTPSDRKSTRLNSSHQIISYAVFCLKKKNNK